MVILTSWNICTSFTKKQSLEVHYPSVQTLLLDTLTSISIQETKTGDKYTITSKSITITEKKSKTWHLSNVVPFKGLQLHKYVSTSVTAIDNNMPCQLNLNHKRYAKTKQSQSEDGTTWVVPCNTALTKGLSISATPICPVATLQAYTNLRTGFIKLQR